jgi:hypothetical protein
MKNTPKQTVLDRFGSRADNFGNKAGLIKAITEKKYGKAKPDPSYISKLGSYSQKRLFDLYGRAKI